MQPEHHNFIKQIPMEFAYGTLAILGGAARYFTVYAQEGKFNFRAFLASTFASGFSGYMFSLLGISLALPQPFIFMLAGVGGFMGDNAMKFLAEYVTKKIK